MIGRRERIAHREEPVNGSNDAVDRLGLELARCVHPFTEVGDDVFPRELVEPRLVRINDEHAARHRPDVNCGIPPAVHYFSPKIGSSSLEYHVSGAGMLPGTMLAVNVESSSRSRPYTVTAFSPFETQPNS